MAHKGHDIILNIHNQHPLQSQPFLNNNNMFLITPNKGNAYIVYTFNKRDGNPIYVEGNACFTRDLTLNKLYRVFITYI